MKININKLKDYYFKINHLIEDYELNNLNYYNEIEKSFSYWNDEQSKKFYSQLMEEKNDENKNLYNMENLISIYKDIIDIYTKLGSKINYNIETKEELLNYFYIYINKINKIINLFNNIDYDFCPNEATKLFKIKESINSISKNIKSIKNNTNSIIDKIEKNEQSIYELITKKELFNIKEN